MSGKNLVIIFIYVDDIVVRGSNNKEIESTIYRMNQTFALKDPGKLHYFLGIEVKRIETKASHRQGETAMSNLRRASPAQVQL